MKTLLKVVGLFSLAVFARTTSAQVQQLPTDVVADSLVHSVTVQNGRKAAVVLYLSSGKTDRRLGVIPALGVSTLPLPDWAVNGRAKVRFVAHVADGAMDLATDEITLQPPGRVGIIIPTAEGAPTADETMSVMISPEDLAEATITVENPRAVPVTVFASKGPFDIRLGQVAANSRATLRFPRSLVGSVGTLTLLVRPHAGLDFATNTLSVRAGEHLALRVPAF
jgi:hypothetical protein